jgi:hypothetical protein
LVLVLQICRADGAGANAAANCSLGWTFGANTSNSIAMQDPFEKMRKAFEDAQAKAELREFVQKCEDARLEKDWQKFIKTVVQPAFSRVKKEFCDKRNLKLLESEELLGNPGFKVQDFQNTEFLFCIKLQGRFPKPQAWRKFGKLPGAFRVTAQFFIAKPNFDLTDVTEDDVVRAVVNAYQKSVQNFQQ